MLFASLIPLLLRGWAAFGSLASGVSGVLVAALSALPGILTGVAAIMREVAASPLWALVFGGAVCGVVAFFYGLSFDAPARERDRAAAIRAANLRADAAIAKIRADYERQVAALRRQTAKRK